MRQIFQASLEKVPLFVEGQRELEEEHCWAFPRLFCMHGMCSCLLPLGRQNT